MKVLFLCVANSARSQMAEGLARFMLDADVEVLSAGSSPKSVHPMAIRALKELGIDISHHSSVSVRDLDLSDVDWVITLCAEEVCPTLPIRARRLHWPVRDPVQSAASEQEEFEVFRTVRDEIKNRIQSFRRDYLN